MAWSVRKRSDAADARLTNVMDAFRDYCKVFAPTESVDNQLKGFVKRYPAMKDYQDYIRRKVAGKPRSNPLMGDMLD
jgi:hypothetical protein